MCVCELSPPPHTHFIGNGFQCFSITMATLALIHSQGWGDLGVVYDNMLDLVAASSLFSLVLCVFLLIKGWVAPSSSDTILSGNPLTDFFRGPELYPRVLGVDLKVLVNCRLGMMSWPILLVCFLVRQGQIYGEVSDTMYVSVGVQLIYIAKFFYWETGYMDTIDIIHDHFGFYICWGCFTWLPSLYTNCTFYLVRHPINVGTLSYLLFVLGVLAVALNYAIDEERQRFRRTRGNTIIWGKKPEYIVAPYTTTSGSEKSKCRREIRVCFHIFHIFLSFFGFFTG